MPNDIHDRRPLYWEPTGTLKIVVIVRIVVLVIIIMIIIIVIVIIIIITVVNSKSGRGRTRICLQNDQLTKQESYMIIITIHHNSYCYYRITRILL